MAQVEINGVMFDVPDDATPDEMEGIANDYFGTPEKSSRLDSAITGISQGLTFGFSDEIGATIASPIQAIVEGDLSLQNLIGNYREGVSNVRELYDKERKDNPLTSVAGELVGGIGTGAAGVAKLGAAKAGALGGAIAGAGTADADSVGEFLGDVGRGAALGGIIGKGGEKLGQAGKSVYDFLRPQSRVSTAIKQNLDEAGLTVDDAISQLRESDGQKVLADLSPGLQSRLSAVAQTPGGLTGEARDLLGERVKGQTDRVITTLEGDLGGTSAYRLAKQNLETAREAAAPLYDEAYAQPIQMTPMIRRVLLDSRAGQVAFRKARKEITDDLDVKDPNSQMALYHLTLQNLRDSEGKLLRREGQENAARRVGNLARAFQKELETQNPVFGEAQKVTRGAFKDNQALELGQKSLREDVYSLQDQVRDMSSTELDSFRVGVFDGIYSKLRNKKDFANAVQDFDKQSVRDAVKIAFNDDQAFDAFMKSVGDEKAMFATFDAAVNNSRTAERLGNRFADPQLSQGVITDGINAATRAALGSRTNQANQVAGNLLTNTDPNAVAAMLRNPPLPSVNPMTAGGVGVLTGGSIYDLTQGG